MKFKGLSALLSKVLDSFASGFLRQVMLGAGLSFGSATFMTGLVNSYVSRIKSDLGSVPEMVLSFMAMSNLDYAISIILSAIVARAAMNSMGIFIKRR